MKSSSRKITISVPESERDSDYWNSANMSRVCFHPSQQGDSRKQEKRRIAIKDDIEFIQYRKKKNKSGWNGYQFYNMTQNNVNETINERNLLEGCMSTGDEDVEIAPYSFKVNNVFLNSTSSPETFSGVNNKSNYKTTLRKFFPRITMNKIKTSTAKQGARILFDINDEKPSEHRNFVTKAQMLMNQCLEKEKNRTPTHPKPVAGGNNLRLSYVLYKDEIEEYADYLKLLSNREKIRAKALEIVQSIRDKKNENEEKNIVHLKVSHNKFFNRIMDNVFRKVYYISEKNFEISEDFVMNLISSEAQAINKNVDDLMESKCDIKNFSILIKNNNETFLLPLINSIKPKKSLTSNSDGFQNEGVTGKFVNPNSQFYKTLGVLSRDPEKETLFTQAFKRRTTLTPIHEHILDESYRYSTVTGQLTNQLDTLDNNSLVQKSDKPFFTCDILTGKSEGKKNRKERNRKNKEKDNKNIQGQKEILREMTKNANETTQKREKGSLLINESDSDDTSPKQIIKPRRMKSMIDINPVEIMKNIIVDTTIGNVSPTRSRRRSYSTMSVRSCMSFKPLKIEKYSRNFFEVKKMSEKKSIINETNFIPLEKILSKKIIEANNNSNNSNKHIISQDTIQILTTMGNSNVNTNTNLGTFTYANSSIATRDGVGIKETKSYKNHKQNTQHKLNGSNEILINNPAISSTTKNFTKSDKTIKTASKEEDQKLHEDNRQKTHRKKQSSDKFHIKTKKKATQQKFTQEEVDAKEEIQLQDNVILINQPANNESLNSNAKEIIYSSKVLIPVKEENIITNATGNSLNEVTDMVNPSVHKSEIALISLLKTSTEDKAKLIRASMGVSTENKKEPEEAINVQVSGEEHGSPETNTVEQEKKQGNELSQEQRKKMEEIDYLKKMLAGGAQVLKRKKTSDNLDTVIPFISQTSHRVIQTKNSSTNIIINEKSFAKEPEDGNISSSKYVMEIVRAQMRRDSKMATVGSTKKKKIIKKASSNLDDNALKLKINVNFNLKDWEGEESMEDIIKMTQNKIKDINLQQEIQYQMTKESDNEGKQRFKELLTQIENLKNMDVNSYVMNLERNYSSIYNEIESLVEARIMEERINKFSKGFYDLREKLLQEKKCRDKKIKSKDSIFTMKLNPIVADSSCKPGG